MTITCEQFKHLINAPDDEFTRHRGAVEEHMANCATHGMTADDFSAPEDELRPYRKGDRSRGILSDAERVARIRRHLGVSR